MQASGRRRLQEVKVFVLKEAQNLSDRKGTQSKGTGKSPEVKSKNKKPNKGRKQAESALEEPPWLE